MARLKTLQKLNMELCRIRDLDLGRLVKIPLARFNYLSIDGWLKIVSMDSIYDCRKYNVIILLYIFGFGTALRDGELEDKHVGVVDCIHMGIIPNYISDLIMLEIKDICSRIQDFQTKDNIQRHLVKGWFKAIKIVKHKFTDIYGCANTNTKKIEDKFRKDFSLNLNFIRKKKRLEIREAKTKAPTRKNVEKDNVEKAPGNTLSLILLAEKR